MVWQYGFRVESLYDRQLMHIVSCTLFLLGCLWSSFLIAVPLPVLVDGEWLLKHQNEVIVLDVRSRTEYMAGHWPEARWAGFKELGWQVDRYGLTGYLPGENELARLLGGLGLSGSESLVVIGSAKQPRQIAEATRVVWSLMVAGFKQVALLDGGIESLSDTDLIKDDVPIHPVACVIRFQSDLLADTNRVEGLLDNNGVVIDFRPTAYFDGVKRDPRIPKPGTILDAYGYPPDRLLDTGTGRFLTINEIMQAFVRYGIPTSGPMATFSDTGVWAALGWFVINRILGNRQVQLYDGSLIEWIDWGGEVHDSTDDMGGPIG